MNFQRPIRLTANHDIDQFDCGDNTLTEWLRRFAFTSDRAGMCSTFVVTPQDEDRVIGFYALSTGGVSAIDAPARLSKGVGRFDIPVILLARLAVDLNFQKQRLGHALLKDALARVLQVSEDVGVRAVLIHAADESARGFYMSFAEFEPSPSDPLHLFLLMKDLRKALSPRGQI